MKKTLYDILGVDPTASIEQIAAAHNRLAALPENEWPDPNTPQFLRQAKEILLDPTQRSAYDASLAGPAISLSSNAESDLDALPVSRWVKWVVVAVASGAALWWATRREPPPAPEPPSRPVVSLTVTQAEPKLVIQPRKPIPQARSIDSKEVRSVEQPVAVSRMPAAAPRTAENVFADAAPSVALVNISDSSGRKVGSGSAVVIDTEVIVTSCHVALAGARISVKVGSTVMPASIKVADETLDLCKLSVPGLRAPSVTVGGVGSLRVGEQVFAIGAPVGLELTISEGIVSALRKVDEGTLIQVTAPVSPGSSGGGLFDLSGQLVGIVTFQHRSGQNLNFALPADWIAQVRPRRGRPGAWRSAVFKDGPQAGSAESLILGKWFCRDWVSGRTGQYDFEVDSKLTIAMRDGARTTVMYRLHGRYLQLSDGKTEILTYAIEELSTRRLIWRGKDSNGKDRSIACERA